MPVAFRGAQGANSGSAFEPSVTVSLSTAGAVAGDLAIVWGEFNSNSETVNINRSGWTATANVNISTTLSARAFHKILTAQDITDNTITLSAQTSSRVGVGLMVFSGTDGLDAVSINPTSDQDSANDTAQPFAAIDPIATSLVAVVGSFNYNASGTDATPPAGWTERVDTVTSGHSGRRAGAYGMTYDTIGDAAVAGGSITTNSATHSVSWTYAIREASAAAPQNLSPSSITSAETIGAHSVGLGSITATATAIAGGAVVASPSVQTVLVSAPSSIASGEVVGVHTASFGALSTIASSIASGEAHESPSVSLGAITASPSSILGAEAWGSPSITLGALSVIASSIAGVEEFGTTTLDLGALTLVTAAISSLETLGDASVGLGSLTSLPASITSSEAFGTSGMSSLLASVAVAIVSGEAFGTAQVNPLLLINPSGLGSLEALGMPTAVLGGDLMPSGIGSGEVFSSPSISTRLDVATVSIESLEAMGNSQASLQLQLILAGIEGAASVSPAVLSMMHGISPAAVFSGELFGTPAVSVDAPPIPDIVIIASLLSRQHFARLALKKSSAVIADRTNVAILKRHWEP